eukprot:683936-Pleurochrysis_carterae.AAC.1
MIAGALDSRRAPLPCAREWAHLERRVRSHWRPWPVCAEANEVVDAHLGMRAHAPVSMLHARRCTRLQATLQALSLDTQHANNPAPAPTLSYAFASKPLHHNAASAAVAVAVPCFPTARGRPPTPSLS